MEKVISGDFPYQIHGGFHCSDMMWRYECNWKYCIAVKSVSLEADHLSLSLSFTTLLAVCA